MPNVIDAKGVHYFDTSYHKDTAWYFAHFASQAERDNHAAKVGHKAVVGEASPYYLFHPGCAERMAKTIPDTKIIVLLRNPVKRAISHHLHMVWEGHESETELLVFSQRSLRSSTGASFYPLRSKQCFSHDD